MSLAAPVAAVHPQQPTTTDDDGDEELAHVERAKDALGFDPRRFFDRPLETLVTGKMNPVERMATIIRGLDRKKKVASLMAVERNLDRGPRDEVMQMLQDRLDYLNQHGERPDLKRASLDERPARYEPARRTVPPKQVFLVERDEDGEVVDRTPIEEERSSTASAKLRRQRDSGGGDS